MSFLSPLKKFFGTEDFKAPDDIKFGGGKYEKYLIAIGFDGTLAMLQYGQLSKEDLTDDKIDNKIMIRYSN